MDNRLSFIVQSQDGRRPLTIDVRALWNGGWAGRDQATVRHHAEELASIGIQPPATVPIYFPLANNLATTSDRIQVLGPETSGEVEYALLFAEPDGVYITVASDHTDRAYERYGIQHSKQLCPNALATEVWPYAEVHPHWDQLVLRCWTLREGRRALYQEAALSALLSADSWLNTLAVSGIVRPGLVFLSGTPPLIGALTYADAYDIELEDPVLGRAIRHHYAVDVLGPGHQ